MLSDKLIHRYYFDDLGKLADGVAQFTATCLLDTLSRRKSVSLVLPGGKTPCIFLPALGALHLPWQQIYLTLSDERWVGTTDANSNEKQLREIFLRHMPIVPCFISLKTDHTHPEEAMNTIEAHLAAMPLPFDLVILGMGKDGHIASLFSGMRLDPHDTHLCQVASPPAAPSQRISLSFHALIKAKKIVFVILGEHKRQLLDHLLTATDETVPFVKLLKHQSVTVFESDAEPIN
ncbi:MAG: 6-phosphogluconolactonase [Nitrosomonas sp.]|nr:6-phosphogluconolactonase [Nitrosomonas sp.]MCC7135713.1 6-phosphogluconolactonase [Nitrosomonas sp.]